eukprot:gene5309-26533_t
MFNALKGASSTLKAAGSQAVSTGKIALNAAFQEGKVLGKEAKDRGSSSVTGLGENDTIWRRESNPEDQLVVGRTG